MLVDEQFPNHILNANAQIKVMEGVNLNLLPNNKECCGIWETE
jgi:hypothetical protein